jgi:outer membrane lipoprotein-sorting protein
MRRAIILGLSILLLGVASAQSQPDLAAVLRKVSDTYKAASQYELIGDATCRVRPPGTTASFHFLIAFRTPNKYRMQAGVPCVGPGTGDMGEALMVLDGSFLWFYFPAKNQYGSILASTLTADAAGDMGDLRPDFVDHSTMWRYRSAVDAADKTSFVREEEINVAGVKSTCYVVLVPPQEHLPEQVWWIDKSSYRVLRVDDKDSSAVFTTIKLNEPLPDGLFEFTPPPGAQKVELDQ